MEGYFTTLLLFFIVIVPMLRHLGLGRQRPLPQLDSDTVESASLAEGPSTNSGLAQYDIHLHDIYHIAFLLRQKLVADLVPAVLWHADLLVPQTSRRTFDPVLRVQQRSAPRYLATSPKTLCKARTRIPVRKVVFDITSHDQGYADNPDAGSWTWFDAEVQRPGVDGKPEMLARRLVVRNRVADHTPESHHIEWTADAVDEETAAWVKNLRVGDRINVVAMAQYSGWTNVIHSVQVTVHTVAVI